MVNTDLELGTTRAIPQRLKTDQTTDLSFQKAGLRSFPADFNTSKMNLKKLIDLITKTNPEDLKLFDEEQILKELEGNKKKDQSSQNNKPKNKKENDRRK